MTTRVQSPTLPITNAYFAQGFEKGRIWYFNGEADLPIDDTYLIQNISAMCERQAQTSPNDLAWHVGFVFGMVSGNFSPE